MRVLAFVVLLGFAGAAGALGWAFAWVVVASAIMAAFSMSIGPAFDLVMTANREGRLGVFPRMWFLRTLPYLAIASAVYFIAKAIA